MNRTLIYPDYKKDDLHFRDILAEINNYCRSDLAREKINLLRPLNHADTIRRFLQQTEECMNAVTTDHAPDIAELNDILPHISYLRIKNYIFPAEELLEIINLLRQRKSIEPFIKDAEWARTFPLLHEFLDGEFPPGELMKFIDEKFDEKGELRENASSELISISRAINAKQSEIDRSFKTIVKKYRDQGILHDTEESIRNGRRVITIDSNYKRQISGIFHDESASGKTTFIEPGEMIPLNNELFNLFNEREKEIKRLLRLTADKIRDISDLLPEFQNKMIWYEVMYAKAKYALSIQARVPSVVDDSQIKIVNGRHPILYRKNMQEYKNTVPFTLELMGEQRVLLVSGPNAGGKSILLKAVGLLQMMVQAGIPVPVDMSSEFGIFTKFFIDIGDQQSVEDDLSTYSSHLTNMNIALKKSDKRSLILFDEFGTGTDPQMGGAIAQAILQQLMRRNVYGLITTHYGNLKGFAAKHKNIVNGALLFNDKELAPTYRLKIGEPGSSYAYEIARNIGLPEHLIKQARKIAGVQVSDIDDLLHKLQQESRRIEEKTLELENREKLLDNLSNTYNHLQEELEIRRKRMKMEAKENALQYLLTQKKELSELINKVREEENIRQAEELQKRIAEEQVKLVEDIRTMEDQVLQSDESSGTIEEGSYVKMRKGEGLTGQVEWIRGKTAMVIFGNLRMEVRLKDLKLIPKTIDIRKGTSGHVYEKATNIQSKLDIRGLDKREAMDLLEAFLDKAIIADLLSVEIIHGKGTGVLRELTREISQQYKDIKEIEHPPAEYGGIGKTIITFG